MKRLALLGVLVAAYGAAPALAGTSFVGVSNGLGDEFSFTLSRTEVKPGLATIEYVNTGEDPHNLKLKRKGSRRVFKIGEKAPGEIGRITTDLKADSKYVLWCSLPEHRSRGMEARLEVKRR